MYVVNDTETGSICTSHHGTDTGSDGRPPSTVVLLLVLASLYYRTTVVLVPCHLNKSFPRSTRRTFRKSQKQMRVGSDRVESLNFFQKVGLQRVDLGYQNLQKVNPLPRCEESHTAGNWSCVQVSSN